MNKSRMRRGQAQSSLSPRKETKKIQELSRHEAAKHHTKNINQNNIKKNQ